MNNIDHPILDKENRHISVLGKENPNKLSDDFRRPVPVKLIINSFPKLFNCLFKVYLKPLAQSSNIRVLVFMIILSFLHVAADFSDMPTVPEFSELKTTEGIIDFDKSTRWGTNLMILQKNRPLVLTCNGGITTNHDCINSEQQRKEYRGKQAKAWWLEQQTLLGMREKLVQLQIDQEIIISYKQQKKNYQTIGFSISVNIIIFLLFLSIYIIAMPLRYISETQRKSRILSH
jgi:hypothetical protein